MWKTKPAGVRSAQSRRIGGRGQAVEAGVDFDGVEMGGVVAQAVGRRAHSRRVPGPHHGAGRSRSRCLLELVRTLPKDILDRPMKCSSGGSKLRLPKLSHPTDSRARILTRARGIRRDRR